MSEAQGAFSVVATMISGMQLEIGELTPETTLALLRQRVSEGFQLPNCEVKLFGADGQQLVAQSERLDILGVGAGAELTVVCSHLDTFDSQRLEEGMRLSGGDRTVEKAAGADLTTALGKAVVSSGARQWNIQVDALGTNGYSNLMIGVAHPDVPLDFVQNVWSHGTAFDLYSSRFKYVKSPGNTSEYWSSNKFGVGDVIAVEVDVDEGTVAFKKNGKVTTNMPVQSGLEGPVSLFINMDYEGDKISIVERYVQHYIDEYTWHDDDYSDHGSHDSD